MVMHVLESEFFQRFDPEELLGLLAILCATLVVLTYVVASQVVAFRRVTRETSLKEQLIKADYTAEDIERVIRAGRPTARARALDAARVPGVTVIKD